MPLLDIHVREILTRLSMGANRAIHEANRPAGPLQRLDDHRQGAAGACPSACSGLVSKGTDGSGNTQKSLHDGGLVNVAARFDRNAASCRFVYSIVRQWVLLAALIAFPSPMTAQGRGLVPPCGTLFPEPAFSNVGQAPNTQTWTESELKRANWSPDPCLGWTDTRTQFAAAIASNFAYGGSLEGLLDRLGAFSVYSSISYWSVSRRGWQPLAQAAGVVGAEYGTGDLHAGDFVQGRGISYFEVDRAGRTIYRLTVREHSDTRAVIATENTSAIKAFPVTLFDAGALQSALFIERHGVGRWSYFQAVRAGTGASFFAVHGAQSYVSRLTALYHYIANQ
jgi:hypothetical protein